MQLRITQATTLKQSTAPARTLPENARAPIAPGTYEISKWSWADQNHYKVTFEQARAGRQTWIIFEDHAEVTDNQVIKLKVPYYSQRDNNNPQWWRQCNSSSHAMLLNFIKPGSVASDDDYIRRFVNPVGDTTDWNVHTQALRQFGIESVYRQNLGYEDLEQSLEAGFPVPIGVLHKGSVHAPSGGHVLLVTGMDKQRAVFYANDPWGTPFSYSNHDGANVEIPFFPSLDRRWEADGDNTGWGRLITAVDGKGTNL